MCWIEKLNENTENFVKTARLNPQVHILSQGPSERDTKVYIKISFFFKFFLYVICEKKAGKKIKIRFREQHTWGMTLTMEGVSEMANTICALNHIGNTPSPHQIPISL